MLVQSYKDYPDIPIGKARIVLHNNGWVGTNNGWPLGGQPALFPESQAYAIALAFDFLQFLGKEKVFALLPAPEQLDDKTFDWLFNSKSKDHKN